MRSPRRLLCALVVCSVAIATACQAPERAQRSAAAQASFDSLFEVLSQTNPDATKSIRDSVPENQLVAIAVDFTDSLDPVALFLSKLPTDNDTTRLNGPADPVFRQFRGPAMARLDVNQRAWGQLQFSGNDRVGFSRSNSCDNRAQCLQVLGSLSQPTVPDVNVDKRAEADEEALAARNQWLQKAGQFGVPRPDVQSFLSWKLDSINSKPVDERLHSEEARGYIALSDCRNGRPRIRYEPGLEKQYLSAGFAFARAHEFAHLKLGHRKCSAGATQSNLSEEEMWKQEFAADCEATKILTAHMKYAHVLVGTVSGLMHTMKDGDARTHPPSAQRAAGLWDPPCSF